jgi:hypothetical protein
MSRKNWATAVSAGLLLAGTTVFTAWALAQPQPSGPERFEGRIMNSGTILNVGTGFFRIELDEYTSEMERLEFIELLYGGGPKRLEDAFLRSRKGRIIINNQGYDIAFARSIPTRDGRIVRMFTVRHLGFDESVLQTRSREYPYGVIELHLNHIGSGEGVLIVAAKVQLNLDGALEVEAFGRGVPALQLRNVRAR